MYIIESSVGWLVGGVATASTASVILLAVTMDGAGPLSVTDVVRLVRAGEQVKYLYFWGHKPRADGSPGAGCLSQWWPASFTVDGVEYATAEHFMMAAKARLFGDVGVAARIVAAADPGEAKNLGRQVRGFDEARWAVHREDVVLRANLAKFSAHPELAGFLVGTGGRVLVEASPMDRIWGIGLAATDERAARPWQWRGLNLLGFALMRVRYTLRSGVDGG